MSEERKRGRPKTEFDIRDTRISGYVTAEDAAYIRRIAENMGFTSTSEMITAILERLCIGGFSAMVFIKLGWQFSNVLSKNKAHSGLYFGIKPLPPLLGEARPPTLEIGEEPDENDISRHLATVKKEVKEKGINDGSAHPNQ